MSVATSTAIALGTGVAAAGSIGGALIGANSADNAAATQSSAATTAAADQLQAEQESLGFQQGVYNENLGLESPYYSAGLSGLTNLESLMGILPASASSTPIPTPTPINIPGLPGSSPGAYTSPTSYGGGVAGAPSGTVGTQGPSAFSAPTSAPASAPQPVYSADGSGGRSIDQLMRGGGTSLNGPVTGQPRGVARPLQMQFPANGVATGTPVAKNIGPPSGTTTPTSNLPSLSSLVNPSLGAPGSLLTPFLTPFQAPTLAQAEQYPGYQFQQQQAMQALQNSAAAKGDLLSGNFAQSAEEVGQGLAQNDYNNVYDQAMQQYQLAQNNSTNIFNRFADLAGLGQTSTQQIAGIGGNAANNVGSTLLNTAQLMGQDTQNAAAATASGYVGAGNAYTGGLNNLSSTLGNLPYLSQLLNGGGGSGLSPSMWNTNQEALSSVQ